MSPGRHCGWPTRTSCHCVYRHASVYMSPCDSCHQGVIAAGLPGPAVTVSTVMHVTVSFMSPGRHCGWPTRTSCHWTRRNATLRWTRWTVRRLTRCCGSAWEWETSAAGTLTPSPLPPPLLTLLSNHMQIFVAKF